jgi:subtilisin family serine protease
MLLAACTMLNAGPFASPAMAQTATKTVVTTQDDLPRFTYPVSSTASALLTADDATFGAFADKVAADVEAMLARYQIEDHATLRGLLNTKSQIEILRGRHDDALKTLAQIRALEDKPDAKLLSGLRTEAMLEAAAATKATSGPAFEAAYAKAYAAKLAPLPWAVVGTRLKEAKASAQIVSADLVVGQAQAGLDPAVAQSHQLSNELAWDLIRLRFALKEIVPVKAATFKVLEAEVAAKNVQKPDIWAARDFTLTAADRLTPVNVAIWDSGTDIALFPDRLYTDPSPSAQTDPHGIAYDLQNNPTRGYLFPLTAEQAALYPTIRGELKGLSDLQLSIDTPEADAVKAKFASLKPDQVPTYLEQLGLFGNYVHGTHVAGIAAHGNPAIRLAVARITFDWKNVPDKPTEELARRAAAASQAYVDWFRRNKVRVVNMSWGGTPVAYEDALEKNGVGKDATERKAMAKHLFGIERDGLYAALKSAPDILFVCAAGNADSDSGFDETIPAGFKLPNLLVVGAVDQAGDEASFTSYGATVRAHANGYQVESFFPGGTLIRESGTSMASPNTVNLAAKLLAIDPSLTPEQVIDLIVAGGTRSEDGRRNNIDPKRSVALLKERKG